MAILTVDLGGTTVKAGYFRDDQLVRLSSVETPATWAGLRDWLKQLPQAMPAPLTGVAISAPGVPDMALGEIRGVSAIPYIHHFPIVAELTDLFKVPVHIENDANCVGYAEVGLGVAKDASSAAFLVLGTGVGGCTFIDGKLLRGAHLYGGEFGGVFSDNGQLLTVTASPVEIGRAYSKATGVLASGQTVFEKAQAGDPKAVPYAEAFFHHMANGIFTVALTVDPALVVIGGGISQNAWVMRGIRQATNAKMVANTTPDLTPEIKAAHFLQDANLIGAAVAWQAARSTDQR